jgi:predicted permease
VRQAAASLEVVARQIEAAHPDTNRKMKIHVLPERLARPEPSSAQQNPVVAAVFLALVGVVLLVACVNVANILLARAAVRQKELAIRAAMGAGRGRLVRQMLTESGMLSVLGIAAGALFAELANVALERVRMPGGIPFKIDLSYDWLTFSFLAGVGLVAGILVGVLPALRASRADLNETLREGGRGNTGGVERHRLRNILVVSQVIGSMVLLIAAGLFIRSLNSAQKAELGFRADHLLNMTIDAAQAGLDRTRSNEFFRELQTRVRAASGVESATVAYSMPFGFYNTLARVLAESQPLPEDPRGLPVNCNYVGTDYLRTIGTPLLRGREINANDTETSPRVAVINELMAKKLWPGQDALGKRFSTEGPRGPFIEVVGITPTGKYQYLFEEPSGYFYAPLTQNYQTQRVLQVRTVGPPAEMSVPLQKLIREIQPNMPVYDPITMDEQLQSGNGVFLEKMGAIFAGALGGLGLLLAVVGVYGVVSYSATQRTHEIGVRMALGAQRADILRMVLRQGVALVGIGIVLGAGIALALGRFLANFLFGIHAYDPLTYITVSLLLATIAVVACLVPARRATQVDPLVALRYE